MIRGRHLDLSWWYVDDVTVLMLSPGALELLHASYLSRLIPDPHAHEWYERMAIPKKADAA